MPECKKYSNGHCLKNANDPCPYEQLERIKRLLDCHHDNDISAEDAVREIVGKYLDLKSQLTEKEKANAELIGFNNGLSDDNERLIAKEAELLRYITEGEV